MKHVWDEKTVYHGRSGVEAHEWARDKQREFEKKSGVKWSWCTAHGKWIFLPYMQRPEPVYVPSSMAIKTILDYLEAGKFWGLDYIALLDLSEGTKLDLLTVCNTCYCLVKDQVLKAEVDRMGKPAIVKLAQRPTLRK